MLAFFVITSSPVFLLLSLFVVSDAQLGSSKLVQPPSNSIHTDSLNSNSIISNFIIKAYRSCAELEMMLCMRKKTINLLETLSKEKRVQLIGDTVQLVRDLQININTTTSRQTTERSLVDSVAKFLNTYRLQINLPKLTFLQSIEEGRKKNKGYGALGLMLGGSILAMGMAALAALSGKALAASLAALMVAAMAALKKGGGGGHGHSSYEVITVPSHHHHRSFYEEQGDHHEHHDGQVFMLDDYNHYDVPYQYEQHIHTSELQTEPSKDHLLNQQHSPLHGTSSQHFHQHQIHK